MMCDLVVHVVGDRINEKIPLGISIDVPRSEVKNASDAANCELWYNDGVVFIEGGSEKMNYGYGPFSKGWIEERKFKLADNLKALCMCYPDTMGGFPYVETDCLYEGVRIRRITHLADEEREELVRKADTIYRTVMEVRDDTT